MNYLVLDVETTIKNKGNPFTKSNRLCSVGIKDKDGTTIYPIEYDLTYPFGQFLNEIKERIERARFIVGFNVKFDLHWIKRYIPDIIFTGVFDCQLGEFLLSGQTLVLPSLDGCCERRNLPRKLDVVSTEYWANGIDTPDVPWDILEEYNEQDLICTELLYEKVVKDLRDQKKLELFWLQCQDLLVLQDMEFNGLRYDLREAEKRGQEIQGELQRIDAELRNLAGTDLLNFRSDDHVSALLYGGSIWEPYREQYTRVLKDGTEKQKERWAVREITFPRMVEPIKGTESKTTKDFTDQALSSHNQERSSKGLRPTQRTYSVAEPILRKLKLRGKAKKIVELLAKRSELEKLDGTYYTGLVTKHREFEWPEDTLHGRFNQCVASTGRLSSADPNLQNFSGQIKDLFYSRYEQENIL
jgi:DNA polymerase I-like protein with 3'-5' exonuclease and polymerase domains